jgi:hypothetical protein
LRYLSLKETQYDPANDLVLFAYTATMFVGRRQWFMWLKCRRMPWLSEAHPHPLWGQHLALSAMPRLEVCFPIGGIALAGTA